MSKHKWTDGPWICDTGGQSWFTIWAKTPDQPVDRTIVFTETADETDKANAHLIAAAPELAEVVEAMATFDGRNNNTHLKEMARAALAKARGESE